MGHAVYLVGNAPEVGTAQGQLQCAVLTERLERTLRHAEITAQLPILRERADRLGKVLCACRPNWLDETRGLAQAAGCEDWQILALNCLPENFWRRDYIAPPLGRARDGNTDLVNAYEAQGYEPLLGGDCTSYFALGGATVAGETLLHKNRDERDEIQNIYIKQLDGAKRFIGGGDIGNLGTAHLHTEDYWAGANNTGSPVAPAEYVDCALNDAHVLRFLAETCAALDDIVPALETLTARQWLGGGGFERGNIWVFADATRALIVEATSRHLAHRWFVEDDAIAVRTNHFLLPEMQPFCLPPLPNSVRRFERANQLWESQSGLLGISICGEIGRDREGAPDAICRNPSDNLGSCTVSSSTATISPHDDRRCQTHFRNCHPSYTHAVIVTPLDRVSDSDLVSGAHNQFWRDYRRWA